ncbi:Hypothetical predicted protein [Olea europaea subsp. europaea]|uniref:Uncharacterized protein n=1 Tax=Olea europaea subsp. europaea TaxID=158383 RepID=A0A8S0VEF0_OLEEU|nr:Hypothetical predicted protein [Olea europaea subsp. europaea]
MISIAFLLVFRGASRLVLPYRFLIIFRTFCANNLSSIAAFFEDMDGTTTTRLTTPTGICWCETKAFRRMVVGTYDTPEEAASQRKCSYKLTLLQLIPAQFNQIQCAEFFFFRS